MARPSDSRIRWVIGTPYFVQGTTGLVEVPILYFIKFGLGMGDAGGQLFDSLRSAGWLVKPVWGLISDKVPLFGYRRKSWYVAMAAVAVTFWALNAVLAGTGLRIPLVFLVTFNIAFAAYAFVDVVCDALMVKYGQESRNVGDLVNFQWTVLAVSSAAALLLGGWMQQRIELGDFGYWQVFLATAVPPLITAVVGLRFIDEERDRGSRRKDDQYVARRAGNEAERTRKRRSFADSLRRVRELVRNNRIIITLVCFIFFWKFSPSIGFIERSYLIDVRGFDPQSFGVILAANGMTFLASLLAYRWVVARFPAFSWHYYLYAMIAIGVCTFPISFFLYLEPDHSWWRVAYFTVPDWLNPLPGWNRYQWFRLVSQVILGFATIPAFIIPLTIAGETVKAAYAGVSYAFLMSLANATDVLEGVVGAGLYALFSDPSYAFVARTFGSTPLDIADTDDLRTLILQIFVYISLLFTILTVPFVWLLKHDLARQNIAITLGGAPSEGADGAESADR